MGQMLVKRLRSAGHEVVVFSRDEAKQYEMQTSGEFEGVEFRLGDIRSYDDIRAAIQGASGVINAAALKQVPACEFAPEQAVLTNCIGMANLIRAAKSPGSFVETVVSVSTDKACHPTNVMGMTKAIQERMMVAANIGSDVRFVGVRYGNVMNSRGSVIPLFKQQIARGGPVTITNPDMTRFLVSLEQAIDLVVRAWWEARPGEIYVPDAPSAKINTLAIVLTENKNVGANYIGNRPGEKIHEVMFSSEESVIRRGEYYVIVPQLEPLWQPEYTTAFRKDLSSAARTIDFTQTKALLEKHGLLP